MSRGRDGLSKKKPIQPNKPAIDGTQAKNALDKIDQLRVHVKLETTAKTTDTFQRNLIVSVLVIVIVSLSLGVVILTVTNNNSSQVATIIVDDTATSSNLKFKQLNGQDFDLITYKGSHIIIDVMGTTCQPCLQQVEILKTFVSQYPQVKVVSVSSDTMQQIQAFQSSHSCSWLLLNDAYGVSSSLNVQYIPTLIHLTPNFREGHRNTGVTDLNTLASWVT